MTVRLEPGDTDDNARLVIDGPTEIVASLMLLISLTLAEDTDCGDPDCPVHGTEASEFELDPGDDDIASAA